MTHAAVKDPQEVHDLSGAPLVTVIVPHKYGLEMITECVESLLESDYPSKEIIVIDNNATDGSSIYLKNKYTNKLKVLRSPVNLYYSGALNLGMKYAHGDYALFLNDDTKVSSTYLSRLVGFMQSDSSVGAVQGVVLSYHPPFTADTVAKYVDQFGNAILVDPTKLDQSKRAHEIFGTAGAAMMVRRDVFERVGGFDDQLVLWWEEADLCWGIRLAGYKCMVLLDAIVYHRGGVTASRLPECFSKFHYWKNKLRILVKYHSARRLLIVVPVVILVNILAVLDEFRKRKITVAAAKVRAISWNFRNARDTLRAQ